MDNLSPEQCLELLREQQVGHVGVIDGENPYVTPVSFVVVGQSIGMRVAPGRRVEAVKRNSRACFETASYDMDSGAWKSVVIEGNARLVTGGREAEDVITALLGKYQSVVSALRGTPTPMGFETILVLDIEEMTGRSSGSFFAMRIRPGRL